MKRVIFIGAVAALLTAGAAHAQDGRFEPGFRNGQASGEFRGQSYDRFRNSYWGYGRYQSHTATYREDGASASRDVFAQREDDRYSYGWDRTFTTRSGETFGASLEGSRGDGRGDRTLTRTYRDGATATRSRSWNRRR